LGGGGCVGRGGVLVSKLGFEVVARWGGKINEGGLAFLEDAYV